MGPGSSLDQTSSPFGTIDFETRMFSEMQSRSTLFFPDWQPAFLSINMSLFYFSSTSPTSTTTSRLNSVPFLSLQNFASLEPIPSLPLLSRSSSISSCSSWTSEPEPTTPTAINTHFTSFEEIEIGDVTIVSLPSPFGSSVRDASLITPFPFPPSPDLQLNRHTYKSLN